MIDQQIITILTIMTNPLWKPILLGAVVGIPIGLLLGIYFGNNTKEVKNEK